MSVPSNLIPARITDLPTYGGSSAEGWLPYAFEGRTYKLQFNHLVSYSLSDSPPLPLGITSPGSSPLAARGDHVHPAVDLSDPTEVSGVLPPARGGLGVTGLTGYLKGTGSAFAAVATIPGSDITGDISGKAQNVNGVVDYDHGGTGHTSYLPGQVLVGGWGSSGLALNKTTLTPGPGVLIDNGPGSITISGVMGGGGTVVSVDVSGGDTGLTTSGGPIILTGTITLDGTLNASSGGTGATSLTGYVQGHGTGVMTAAATVPVTDIVGTKLQFDAACTDGDFLYVGDVAITNDAPSDGNQYGRVNGAWAEINATGGAVSEWNWNTTVGPPPASQTMRGNNATQTAITTLYFNDTNINGADVSNYLMMVLKTGVKIYVQQKNNATVYQVWQVTGAPTHTGGAPSYVSVPVVWSSGGTVLSAGRVSVTLIDPVGVPTDAPTDGSFYGRKNAAWAQPTAADITAGQAITAANDTNVTLTLGGTPTTAALKATSFTMGWTGTLSVARGGTGAATLTGYLKGNGTSAVTASATIPNTDISGLGTMATQNANAVAITGGTAGLASGSTTGAWQVGGRLTVNNTISDDNCAVLQNLSSTSYGGYIRGGGVSGRYSLLVQQYDGTQLLSVTAGTSSFSTGLSVTGALSTANALSVGGSIELQTNHGGGGLSFRWNSASTASRTWAFSSDTNAYGDFSLLQSTTQTGNPTVSRTYWTAAGNVAIGYNADLGSRLHIGGANANNTSPTLGTIGGDSVLTLSNNANIYGLNIIPSANGQVHIQSQYFNGNTAALPLNLQPAGGNVVIGATGTSSYKLWVGGAGYYGSTLDVAGAINANGARAVTLDPTGGNTLYRGDSGGWVTGDNFYGSGSTYLGTIGALGGGNTLSYWFIGPAYNSALSFCVYPDGHITAGGDTQAPQFSAKASGFGGMTMKQSGTSANTGYLEFLNSSGGRLGYIGFQSTAANGNIQYFNENSGSHQFSGPVEPHVSTTSYLPAVRAYNDSSSTTTYSAMEVRGAGIAPIGYLLVAGSTAGNAYTRDRVTVGAQTAHALSLNTSDATKMLIDTAGTTFVPDNSSIVGSGRVRVQRSGSDSYAMCTWHSADYTALQLVRVGSEQGRIDVNSTGTSYVTTSDERLKKNIQPTGVSSGTMIDDILVAEFDWIETDEHTRFGFIAQQLNTVVPEAVSPPPEIPLDVVPLEEGAEAPNPAKTWYGVDSSKLVPLLVKEIQELRKRVAVLEAA